MVFSGLPKRLKGFLLSSNRLPATPPTSLTRLNHKRFKTLKIFTGFFEPPENAELRRQPDRRKNGRFLSQSAHVCQLSPSGFQTPTLPEWQAIVHGRGRRPQTSLLVWRLRDCTAYSPSLLRVSIRRTTVSRYDCHSSSPKAWNPSCTSNFEPALSAIRLIGKG